jgi:hypothetical protein
MVALPIQSCESFVKVLGKTRENRNFGSKQGASQFALPNVVFVKIGLLLQNIPLGVFLSVF